MSETTEELKVKEYEVSENDVKEMGDEIGRAHV